ncbi:hypothetical protein C8R46DRAFT_1029279 [Mycena filopes]|nr:hypothetical protein C8R46DRAFT_1029279 [Mycena filopes]
MTDSTSDPVPNLTQPEPLTDPWFYLRQIPLDEFKELYGFLFRGGREELTTAQIRTRVMKHIALLKTSFQLLLALSFAKPQIPAPDVIRDFHRGLRLVVSYLDPDGEDTDLDNITNLPSAGDKDAFKASLALQPKQRAQEQERKEQEQLRQAQQQKADRKRKRAEEEEAQAKSAADTGKSRQSSRRPRNATPGPSGAVTRSKRRRTESSDSAVPPVDGPPRPSVVRTYSRKPQASGSTLLKPKSEEPVSPEVVQLVDPLDVRQQKRVKVPADPPAKYKLRAFDGTLHPWTIQGKEAQYQDLNGDPDEFHLSNARRQAVNTQRYLPAAVPGRPEVVVPVAQQIRISQTQRSRNHAVHQKHHAKGKPLPAAVLNSLLVYMPQLQRWGLPAEEIELKQIKSRSIYHVFNMSPPVDGPQCPSYWNTSLDSLEHSSEALGHAYRTVHSLTREHQYNQLLFLKTVLETRREILNKTMFYERFESKEAAEFVLRVALAQGVTSRTEVTRDFVWHYCRDEDLMQPIPDYASAYDFYEALDASRAQSEGYLNYSQDGEPATWRGDFDSIETERHGDVVIGPNVHKVARRLAEEAGEPVDSSIDLPKDTGFPSSAPASYFAPGLFQHIYDDDIDLEALEASTSQIPLPSSDETDDEDEDMESGGRASSSEESESESNTTPRPDAYSREVSQLQQG